MDEALLSISLANCGQLMKMLITLEPHGIFGSNYKLDCFKIGRGYLQLTVNSQKTLKWLFTVDCQ